MPPPNQDALIVADVDPERSARTAFLLMAIAFGVNHGTVTTPIGYASSILQKDTGNFSNGLLYGVTMLSALFFAPAANSLFGPKRGLLLGMSCYTIYVLCFAAGALACAEHVPGKQACREAGTAQWAFVLTGSTIGGLGAGVLWTCQGAFFTAIVERMTEARQHEVNDDESRASVLNAVTSELAATFAIYFLVLECISKAMFTVLQKYIAIDTATAFFIYAGFAAVSTVAFSFSQDLRSRNAPLGVSFCSKASSALKLWADPKLSLLMFTNFSFGFSVAWLNGYVNSNFLKEAIDSTDFIGFLGALICIIAAISSRVFGWVATKVGKLPIVLLGSCCFFGVGVLSTITYPDDKGPGGWGLGILAFYVLQGLGRGVYESTNKGIFADFFPGPKGPAAFANVMSQCTFSSSIGFILQATGVFQPVLYLLLVFSVLTFPCILAATALKNREDEQAKREASVGQTLSLPTR